ncbi:MAG: TIGR03032 family protein [Burkholderiales bacterium]
MTDTAPSYPPEASPAPATTSPPDVPEIEVIGDFARVLRENRISLLVSTYDTGKVFILRAVGPGLNVHFVSFDRAMGIAASTRAIAVGSFTRIHELFNMPALIPRLPPSEMKESPYDACYVPRIDYYTGDIQIHEMAYAGDELWFVNTRFSCLCTLEKPHSFAPRWRPPWIKGLSADDRCHLNGLAIRDGRPAYVTAFATSDEPAGWRPTKATSGLVAEVPSGRIVTQGLSMPHSPRWHANNLWVLDSGRGTMARVDPETGQTQTFADLNGFTRGLDFHRTLAFIGLSRVRESNIFGGLPLTERLAENERFCGLQALNLSTGKVEAALKFTKGVNEIFGVQVLPGITFPAVLDSDDELLRTTYALSPQALAQVRQ